MTGAAWFAKLYYLIQQRGPGASGGRTEILPTAVCAVAPNPASQL